MVHGNRKFSEEVEQEICSAYKAGESSIALGKRFKCSADGVRLILKRNGIKARSLRQFTDQKEEDICNAYKKGESSPQLAKRFSCSKRTILSVLKRHSIEMRTDRRRFTDEQEQEIDRL